MPHQFLRKNRFFDPDYIKWKKNAVEENTAIDRSDSVVYLFTRQRSYFFFQSNTDSVMKKKTILIVIHESTWIEFLFQKQYFQLVQTTQQNDSIMIHQLSLQVVTVKYCNIILYQNSQRSTGVFDESFSICELNPLNNWWLLILIKLNFCIRLRCKLLLLT